MFFNKTRTFLAVLLVVSIFVIFAGEALAQDDLRWQFNGKMGSSSKIGELADSRLTLGFGIGYRPVEKLKGFYFEPGILFHFPKSEDVVLNGDLYRQRTNTILLDANVNYEAVNRSKLTPYISGGIGLLRNSVSATDYSYRYNLGSANYFTKNIGTGLKYRLSDTASFGVVAKQYFAYGKKFRIYAAEISFRFGGS